MERWLWSGVFGIVLAACALIFVVAPSQNWWLPELRNAESFGRDADRLFYVILAFTGFFFLLTEAILVFCMWKYSHDPERRATYTHGNHRLEMMWTVVPALILLYIAFAQISTWADIKYESSMPQPDQVIDVSARQFEWRIRYPTAESRDRMLTAWKEGGDPTDADQWGKAHKPEIDDVHLVNEVHTWKDASTRIYLSSRDVLHSFFLPNMRLKQDAVPGRVIPVWFRPTEHNVEWNSSREKLIGEPWPLACAELCGWGHYKMKGRLYVHKDKESYDQWLAHTQAQTHARSESD